MRSETSRSAAGGSLARAPDSDGGCRLKLLWVNSNFMHPTTKGGQIRTLEMLRYLHQWHEIHYVALENRAEPEGPSRAHEYSTKSYPYPHRVRDKRSLGFAGDLVRGLFHKEPVAVSRFHPPGMRDFLENLIRLERFDAAVMDYLVPTAYFPDRAHAVLFQHNVEFMIWRRHAENARGRVHRAYFKLQAQKMFEYERQACRESGHVVACSDLDQKTFREAFEISKVSTVPTGVNIDYFRPPDVPAGSTAGADFVFVGSMDWMPNEQGVLWFAHEILPLIRRRRPQASFAVVGRTPTAAIQALAQEPGIVVTGTVADVRPWFWESAVSVVPLLVGGGTRLKIYEAMAAKTATVSTTVGAEGLEYKNLETIRIADTAADFAEHCLDLIDAPAERTRMAACAWELVNAHYSWEVAARAFHQILEKAPHLP